MIFERRGDEKHLASLYARSAATTPLRAETARVRSCATCRWRARRADRFLRAYDPVTVFFPSDTGLQERRTGGGAAKIRGDDPQPAANGVACPRVRNFVPPTPAKAAVA